MLGGNMRDNKEFIKSLTAIGPKQSLPRFFDFANGCHFSNNRLLRKCFIAYFFEK